MSEAATNKSNDSVMEEVASAATSSANDGFKVHRSHTCDGCSVSPIIGKRFKATDTANYDLCSKCFAAYDGEELFDEILLDRDRKSTKDYVLKLKTNDGAQATQIRRVSVSDLWGDDELSFSRLVATAAKFASTDEDVDVSKAKVTYVDGDGDKITISTDGELTDSFRQTLRSNPSPFRLSVNFPMGNADVKKVPATAAGKNPQKLMRIERQIARKSDQLEALKVKAKLASASGPSANGGQKPMGWMNAPKFDSTFFIHARHTCDGCSKTPIIGTRYHATKIPDFDLCANCYSKYEGEDLDFKPEALDRDRSMQHRWLRRQLSNSRMCEIHASPPCEGFRPNKKAKAEGQAKGSNGGNHVEAAIDFLKTLSPAVVQSLKDVEIHISPPCQGDGKPKSDEEQAPKDEIPLVHVSSPCQGISAVAASKPDSEEGSNETEPKSDASGSNDDSFFSDADGNSIAEVIGRTLDVCVQAMEDVMIDDAVQKSTNDVAAAATAVAADAFSVASSIADALKNSDDFKSMNASSQTDAVVESKVEEPKTDEASNAEDDWSVVDDEKDASKAKEVVKEEATDKSVTSVEPISPVVLAKWDAELKQLHELGFLDDRVNTDALEQLEASHIGCGSDETVTVNAVVEHLLK